jgi:filamentous hemagglutinin
LEFPEITTIDQFAEHIEKIMQHPSASKGLSRGREAFGDQSSGTVVIRDPNSPDLGTAFKPKHGRSYYDNLR